MTLRKDPLCQNHPTMGDEGSSVNELKT